MTRFLKRHPFLMISRASLLLASGLMAMPAQADTVRVEIEFAEKSQSGAFHGELEDNVRKFLSIAADHEGEWSASRIARLHRRARGEIESALQPYGYYRPQITSTLTSEGDQWRARYRIQPGPPTIVTALLLRIEGEGSGDPAIQAPKQSSQLATGRQLRHAEYSDTKTALYRAAYDRGYLDAAFRQAELRINPETSQAEVQLVLDTGRRYFSGPIAIEQQILDAGFAQKYVEIQPGEPFSTKRLNALQLTLSDSGYFSQIEFDVQREALIESSSGDPAQQSDTYPRLPVQVRALPSKPQKYTARAGYGTDTGARVGLGLELRRVNRRGHRFRSELQLSEIKQAFSARYIIPVGKVATDQLSFAALANVEEFGDTSTSGFSLSSSWESAWRLGKRRLYLNLEQETFDFGGPSTTSELLFPGVALSYERADNLQRTRRGISLSADLHGGSASLLSSTDFIQLSLQGAGVLPLGSRGRLLLRGQVAATEVDEFDLLPPTQRFFTGGDRSVRGYSYRGISPVNDDGREIGGQYLAVASIEADYLIYRDYGAAIFMDAGDASDTTRLDPKRGVGVGLRWASPIGMVRLDFAHPLDDPDTNLRVHFSLGPDL